MMKFLKAKINGTNILTALLAALLTVGALGGCKSAEQATEPVIDPVQSVQPSGSSGYMDPDFVATEDTSVTTIPVVTEPSAPPVTETTTTEPTVTTVPATKPVETTPTTKPVTTKPVTSTPVTTVPSTTPTTPTTTPTVPTETVDPNHTHKYTKEYVTPWGGGQAYYVYTCSCGHSYQEAYSCGTEGHICFDEAAHNALMKYIEKGCIQCGSSECPCLLAISVYGTTWPDYTQCPQYDVYKDPTVYCQTCGLIKSHHAESGQECCRISISGMECSWCGKEREAGACHQCTAP